jgi:hypothetical protein
MCVGKSRRDTKNVFQFRNKSFCFSSSILVYVPPALLPTICELEMYVVFRTVSPDVKRLLKHFLHEEETLQSDTCSVIKQCTSRFVPHYCKAPVTSCTVFTF